MVFDMKFVLDYKMIGSGIMLTVLTYSGIYYLVSSAYIGLIKLIN